MATVYSLQKDPGLKARDVIRDKKEVKFPFVTGTSYKGDWLDNCKHGFGVEIGLDGNKYEGEWERDMKHGKGTYWRKKGGKFIKQYEGEWEDNLMSGYGVHYLSNGNVYKGHWIGGKRNGKGRMEYTNGDIYDGEWFDGLRNGMGTLFVSTGNIYEGHWIRDMKEGPGKFLYASTRKVYTGEWAADIPQCGEYREPTEEEDMMFNEPGVWKATYELPGLKLANSRNVLDNSIAKLRAERGVLRGLSNVAIPPESIDTASELFSSMLENAGNDPVNALIPLNSCAEIFKMLGVEMNEELLESMSYRLEISLDTPLSFPEIVDLSSFMLGQ